MELAVDPQVPPSDSSKIVLALVLDSVAAAAPGCADSEAMMAIETCSELKSNAPAMTSISMHKHAPPALPRTLPAPPELTPVRTRRASAVLCGRRIANCGPALSPAPDHLP